MRALAVLVCTCLVVSSWGGPQRSRQAINEFKRANPCPANGARRGACPGYVVDHVEPLCAGGPDSPANMAWQSVEDAKKKDAQERQLCRALKQRPEG